MKNFFLTLVVSVLLVGAWTGWQGYKAYNRLELEKSSASWQCDQLQKLLKEVEADVSGKAKAVAATSTELGNTAALLVQAQRERDDAKNDAAKLAASLAAVKRELAEEKLKESRASCPPPEKVAAEKQEQTVTPWEVGANGKRKWMSDFAAAEEACRKTGRPMALIISTVSCKHCEAANRACKDPRVLAAAFKSWAPCWITILDEETEALGKRFGVYEVVDERTGRKYGCPALITRFADSDEYTRQRPGESPEELLEVFNDVLKK